ncbi:MAG: DUF4112 domain-containing protein [Sulfurifustaceae bacterium]
MKKSPRVISVDSSGNVQSVEEAGVREMRRRLRHLAWLLDSSIPLPGTRFTIGVDALLGLFPVVGDLLGVLISSYIVKEAARLGAPRIVLARMAFNIAVEGVIGIVPFAGDVFDAAWKANQRNVRLLDAWVERPGKTERASRGLGVLLVVALAAFLVLSATAAVLLARWMISILG